MESNSAGPLTDLSARLSSLADLLGGGQAAAVSSRQPDDAQRPGSPGRTGPVGRRRAAPAPAPAPLRPATTPVLRSANAYARDAPLGGLLQRYRDAEAGWLKEKGKLMLAADGEKKRRLKAEAELRRVQQQLSFRVGEVQHLKTGLRSRDCELQDLRDRLREYELAEGGERTAQEAVAQAQAERDELRAAMAEVLQRLDAANDVIGRADSSMASLEAQLAAATAERQRAEDAERAAQAEAQQLREAVADMQWKCGLLQRLSDLTMQQNEEKTATLQTLLESESMLDGDGEAAGGGGRAGGPSSDDGMC